MTRSVFLLLVMIACLFINVFAQNDEDMIIYELDEHDGKVLTCKIGYNGQYLASGGDDKRLLLWNLQSGELVKEYPEYYYDVNDVQFSSDMNFLFGAGGRMVKMYETGGEYIKRFRGHSTFVWSIALTDDNAKMVTGAYGDKFFLWDVFEGELIKKIEGHDKSVLSVAISPDQKFMASGSLDRTIRIWDMETHEQVRTFQGNAGNIYDLVFTPDSRYLISAGQDNTLRIWDIENEDLVRILQGHGEAVMSVSVHPDGKHALSGSWDKTIKLWNLTDGKCVYTYDLHDGLVNQVDFGPEGKIFASAAEEEELFVWKVDPELYVDAYFYDQLKEEMADNSLFDEKRDDEKNSEYKERLEEQKEFKDMLYEKYFNQYKLLMKKTAIIEDEQNQDAEIKID